MTRRLAPVPDHPRRAVLYVRVSALMGRSGEKFHSPATQEAEMRTRAARDGATVVEVIEDIDKSGRDFNREGIRRVMELARGREIDVVYLYDLSRLGRNTGESLRHIRELRDLGVAVVSTVENIEDTPEGQFSLTLFLGIAELYSAQVGRKWKQSLDHRVEVQGLFPGPPPVGYRRGERTIEPDPMTGPLMGDALRAYARGVPRARLGRELQAAGVLANPRNIRQVLSNPVYAGMMRWRGETVAGVHEPLVDAETWGRVMTRLAEDGRVARRYAEPQHPFTGLARCAYCSRALTYKAGQRGRPYMSDANGTADTGCPGVGTPTVAELEQVVLDKVAEMVSRLRAPKHRRQAQARASTAKADARRLRRERESLDRALGQLAADHQQGKVIGGDTAYEYAARALQRQRDQAQAALDRLTPAAMAPETAERIRLAEALLARWDRMTMSERNAALRSCVKEIRVSRDRVRQPVDERVEVVDLTGQTW